MDNEKKKKEKNLKKNSKWKDQKSKLMHLDELSQQHVEEIKPKLKIQSLFQSIPNANS